MITITERCGNKPMDHSYCPLGSLRKEARRTAAIGLRIAIDKLGHRWSWQGQIAYDEAKKTADDASTAWNQHLDNCAICREARSGFVPEMHAPAEYL